jgi:hypothetical protein
MLCPLRVDEERAMKISVVPLTFAVLSISAPFPACGQFIYPVIVIPPSAQDYGAPKPKPAPDKPKPADASAQTTAGTMKAGFGYRTTRPTASQPQDHAAVSSPRAFDGPSSGRVGLRTLQRPILSKSRPRGRKPREPKFSPSQSGAMAGARSRSSCLRRPSASARALRASQPFEEMTNA